jgi:hypothetical protein
MTALAVPREPNGKFKARPTASAAPPPPPVGDSAPVVVARLQAMRAANNGLVYPKPDGIDTALSMPVDATPDGMRRENAGFKAARDWFQRIAAVGEPGDLDLAWAAWRPVGAHVTMHKEALRREVEALKDQAGRRMQPVYRQLAAIRDIQSALSEAGQRLSERRHALKLAEQEVAKEYAAVANLEAGRAAAQRRLAEEEARPCLFVS